MALVIAELVRSGVRENGDRLESTEAGTAGTCLPMLLVRGSNRSELLPRQATMLYTNWKAFRAWWSVGGGTGAFSPQPRDTVGRRTAPHTAKSR